MMFFLRLGGLSALLFLINLQWVNAQTVTMEELNLKIGVLDQGPLNAITDVEGVSVGHVTLNEGDDIRTGVTAILPHQENIFQQKVPAAVYVGNGFGKLAGSTQVQELGNLETPVILTNTLSVPTAADAVIDYTLNMGGNEEVRSVNPLVGETNDGYLNDIRSRHLSKDDVLDAIESASESNTEQGNVGAGTGTVAFGFKGGIGTSSRRLPEKSGGYTVGVLVQTNFGGVLQVDGLPVGKELGKYFMSDELNDSSDGSLMVVIATDAPLSSRNLERLSKRALLGMAKTGGVMSNGSGDYVIAFSTDENLRVPFSADIAVREQKVLHNNAISPLFMAAIEATEEAILQSLFHAETMSGRDGNKVEALPIEEIKKMQMETNFENSD